MQKKWHKNAKISDFYHPSEQTKPPSSKNISPERNTCTYSLHQKSHTVGFLLLFFLFSCDVCNILVPRAIFSNIFKSWKVSWAEGLGCHEWWNPMIIYSHCTVYKCRWWDSICHWFLSFCPEFYLGLLKEVRIFEEVCMQNATFLLFLTNL